MRRKEVRNAADENPTMTIFDRTGEGDTLVAEGEEAGDGDHAGEGEAEEGGGEGADAGEGDLEVVDEDDEDLAEDAGDEVTSATY